MDELDEMNGGTEDLGEPVLELQRLRDPVPEGFLDRIRGTIRRRELAADVTRFTLWTPFVVFLEYVGAFFEAMGPGSPSDQSGAAEPRGATTEGMEP